MQQDGAHGLSLQTDSFSNSNARLTSLGSNLSDDASDLGNPLVNSNRTDRVNIDARLGPLAYNGGPTQTCALLDGSPALDAGNTTLAFDQRGVARPQGAGADIGAFERADETGGALDFVVTTTGDAVANDGQTSLREAINLANQTPGANDITFKVSGPITVGDDLPALTDDVNFVGPATIKAADPVRETVLFTVNAGVKASFENLTIGRSWIGIVNSGTISVANCALKNNRASDILALDGASTKVRGCILSGGGLFSRGDARIETSTLSGDNGVLNVGTLTAISCTFSARNSGVLNFNSLNLIGCTFSGSERAIFNGKTLLAFNCTLSGNQTAIGSGSDSTTRVINGTISGNAIGVFNRRVGRIEQQLIGR